MTVCLSPNGSAVTSGSGPAAEILVGTVGGLYRLRRQDPESGWDVIPAGLRECHVGALLHHPGADTLFAGTYEHGLLRSEDGGSTWTPCAPDEIPAKVFTLALQPGAPARLYVGTEPAALYRSDDLGKSFEPLPSLTSVPSAPNWTFPPPPHHAHVKCVAFHPTDSQHIYVGIEQGALLVSYDDGSTWEEITSYEPAGETLLRDIHRVVFGSPDPATVYMTTGDGLFCSSDGGETWARLSTQEDRIGYPDFFFLDPERDQTVYMCGASIIPNHWRTQCTTSVAPGILRSEDGGRTWQTLMAGLPDPVPGSIEAASMCTWPGGWSLYVATTTGSVYATEDRGETWSVAAEGLPPISKVGHYRLLEPARP